MNVLFIPSWYPIDETSTVGSFFKEQAIALAEQGHRVVVLNASFQDRKNMLDANNYKVRKLQYVGVTEYAYNTCALGIWRKPNICSRLFSHYINKLWSYVDNKEFDIIQVHSFYPAGVAAIDLSRKTNIPIVYTEHASGVMFNEFIKGQEQQLRSLISYSSKVIAVSQNLKKALERFAEHNQEIQVVPNMVDTNLFRYCQKKSCDSYTYLTVGGLNENKRIDWTVKAFYELSKTNDNISLQIVGEGPEKKHLIHLIHELHLDGRVKLEGACSREYVAQLMQTSDSFVLDSKVETFGVVYIEALACGIPIVIPMWNSSNIDILEDNHVLIEDDTIESLMNAMKEVYDRRTEFDAYLISKQCVEYYSGKCIAKRMIDIYKDVIVDMN